MFQCVVRSIKGKLHEMQPLSGYAMSTKVRGIPIDFVFRESDPFGQTQELKYSKNKKWQEPNVKRQRRIY